MDALRFGVLHDAPLEAWQSGCLDALAGSAAAALIVRLSSAATRAVILSHDLDFVLCFADLVPDGRVDVPRFGMWRFGWGDWVHDRGAHAPFWEVYERDPVSAGMLVRLTADPDEVIVLRQGFLRTQALSARRNREQWYQRFVEWPAAVCREIMNRERPNLSPDAGLRESGLLNAPRLAAQRAPRRAPSALARAVLAARIGVRIAATAYRALFRHDQWNIGIIDRPLETLLTLNVATGVNWLPPTPRAELRADPFGSVHAGVQTLFCEYFSYRDQRGTIVAMDPTGRLPALPVRIGPEPPVHLSYPFLLEHEGRLLCLPESSAAGEVAVYTVERFPDRWTRVATLLSGTALADASVFEYEDRWWLAASEVADKGANSELHLFHAQSPTGPWTAHPGNPVKIDVRSARPAGQPFIVDGVLYRPAQDCSTSYGARVVINRIVTLTPAAFHEEAAAVLNPDPRGPYPDGLHTVARLGDRTLIDGKRTVFVPAECWRLLRHYLLRHNSS